MDGRTVEKDLIRLEKQYWQTMKDKDVEAASRLTDYPCVVAGATGVASVDQKAFAAMLSGSKWTIEDFDMDDVEVRMLSDDVAIIAYKIREKLTVEDEPVTLDAADASVWVRRDGEWRCALHTESVSGDPYGRDRKPAN